MTLLSVETALIELGFRRNCELIVLFLQNGKCSTLSVLLKASVPLSEHP